MTSTLLPLLLASTLILARAATEQPPSLAPVTVATARSSGTVSEATEQPPSPIPTVAVAQTFGPVSPSSSTPFEFGLSCRAILHSFGSFCDYVIEYTECFSQETIQRCKKIKRDCGFRHSDGSRRLSICQSSLAYSCSYLDRAFTDKIVIEYCDVLLTLCTGGFAIPTSTLPYYYSDSSSDSSGAGIGTPTLSPIYDGYGSTSSGPRTEDSLTHSLPAGTAVPTSGYGGYGSSSSGPRTGDSLTHSRPAGTAVPTSGYDGYGSGSGLSGSGSSSGSFSGFRCFGINSGSGSISGFGSSSGSGSSGITDGSGRPDGESGSGRPDGKSRSGRPDGGSGSGRPDGGSGSGRPDGKSRSGRPDGNSRSGRPDSKSGSGRSGNDSDSRKPDGDGSITPENDTLSTTTEPTVTTLMPIIKVLVNVEDLTSQQKENIVNIILTGLKEEQFLRTSVTFFREEIFRLVNMYLSYKGNNRQKRQQSPLSPNDVVIVEPLIEVEGGLQVAFVVGGGEGQSAPISGNEVMSVLEAQPGMTSPVRSVTFNQTENWVGAGSKSGGVKIFDLDENKVVRSISGHKAAVCSVDFHRFGDVLASGSLDTNLKLWDVRRKGCIFTYKGHSESINSIQFSPDGKWVVSASSDSTIKLWDLCAGRMLADFKDHKGPVTSIEFHPREYLLASGSTDRTAKVWDLESFQLLTELGPESNPVRRVLFHPEGSALFSGSQDTLKVHGWEPVVTYDQVYMRWDKVADVAIYDDQLVGATFAQTNVSLFCVNIETLKPFSGESSSPQPSTAVNAQSSSGRKHFEYERQEVAVKPASQRPHTQASGTSHLVEEESCSPSSSSEELGVKAGESPPTDEERREIFAARQRLMRTPPKYENAPFIPPLGNEATPIDDKPNQGEDPPPPSSAQPSELNRVQVLQIHSSDVRSSDKEPQQPKRDDRSSINVASHRVPPQQSDAQVGRRNQKRDRQGGGRGQDGRHGNGQQQARKAPSRDLIDEFMKPPTANVSESRRGGGGGGLISESRVTIREVVTNHSDVSQILKSRLEVLKDVRAEWSVSEPKSALEAAINSGNTSALVDLLNVLHLKRTLWTLDLSLLVLPELHSLVSSRHASHVKCCCKVLKLVLKSFGPLIKTNMATPPSHIGVDITREERYERCLTCHSHLTSLRDEASRLVRDTPTSSAGKVIREQNLLTAFSILD